MTILDKIQLMETAPLSTVCDTLFEMGYYCTIAYEMLPNGKWISITVEKDGEKWAGIGGSRIDVARNRLVEWADRLGLRDFLIS